MCRGEDDKKEKNGLSGDDLESGTLSMKNGDGKKKTEDEIPNVAVDDVIRVFEKAPGGLSAIDNEAKHQAVKSDDAYQKIAKDIVDRSAEHLGELTEAKKPLRKKLMAFVMHMLAFQFAVLAAVLFLKTHFLTGISDYIINVFIVSLFAETLTGLIIMIKYAFDSSQEVQLISILNSVITNYKKFKDDD